MFGKEKKGKEGSEEEDEMDEMRNAHKCLECFDVWYTTFVYPRYLVPTLHLNLSYYSSRSESYSLRFVTLLDLIIALVDNFTRHCTRLSEGSHLSCDVCIETMVRSLAISVVRGQG